MAQYRSPIRGNGTHSGCRAHIVLYRDDFAWTPVSVLAMAIPGQSLSLVQFYPLAYHSPVGLSVSLAGLLTALIFKCNVRAKSLCGKLADGSL